MKNNILIFLLGFFVAISIAATTTDLMQVQPAQPKHTVVQTFRTLYSIESDMKTFIDAKIKEGYIVKSVAMSEDEDRAKAIVVMEKY